MSNTSNDSEIIIKAISNEIRRNIIRLLVGKSITYSEIAHLLSFDLKTQSGKFNFHLKELVKAELIYNENETYQLTDKGDEIYYLLVDIERDKEIDPHGMLTALIKLDGMREFSFFLASISLIGTFSTLMIGIMAFFAFGEYIWLQVLGGILIVSGGWGLLVSSRYYIFTLNDILGQRSTFSKIVSSLFFLNVQWYFIRGKSRISYMFATFFVLFGWMLGLISLVLGISSLGGLEQIGNEYYIFLGMALTSLTTGIFLLRRLYTTAKVEDQKNSKKL